MNKARLEAFSDGVLAIIITIMVLEIKVPHEPTLAALNERGSTFICYLMSFVFVAIYWVNHHHLLHCVKKVTVRLLWANMSLLFTLSLVPFTTGWMGENHYAQLPTALYCANLLLCGFAAGLLQASVTAGMPPGDKVFSVIKQNLKKTIASVVFYVIALVCSFWYPKISLVLIALVAVIWVIPDKRIEQLLEND